MPLSPADFSPILLAAATWGVGMYTDVRQRRISNLVNGIILTAGFIMCMLQQGPVTGAKFAAGGVFVALAVVLPFHFAGAMGAGDAKFMAAIGAWLGWRGALYAMAAGGLLGGALALTHLLRRDQRSLFVTNMALLAQKVTSGRVFDDSFAGHRQLNEGRLSMPYGVFLGIGGLAVLAGRLCGWEV